MNSKRNENGNCLNLIAPAIRGAIIEKADNNEKSYVKSEN